MSKHVDRPNTALLVIDMQNAVVRNAYARDAVIANINELVQRARREKVPVIWVQDHGNIAKGSDDWKIINELSPEHSEHLVEKIYGDAFDDTLLESILLQQKVGQVVVVGAQTDACIRATLHGAIVRGYDTILVSDAHTTEDHSQWGAPTPDKVIAHTNLYWSYHTAPGRFAGTFETRNVVFSGRG